MASILLVSSALANTAPTSATPRRVHFRRHGLALAATLALSPAAWAQDSANVVQVTGRATAAPVSVSGFGDVSPGRSPFQSTSSNAAGLADIGIDTLGEITRLDASLGDAYNAPGYWAAMRVRGYALDNRFNYRRDGLPINGETALALDNKERVEVLKGTSGAQAGTSAPGGLVNLAVKRPRGGNTNQFLVGLSEAGSMKLAADLDRVVDTATQTGVRLNLSAEQLDPLVRDAKGSRHLFALAGTTQLGQRDRLEGELEISRQSQPSIPGFSLLGSTLPDASTVDPRTNLNNQRWSLPVVFDSRTASLRWTHTLDSNWQVVSEAMTQRLTTDDRLAFPFGCSAVDNYSSYCADGTYDLYDFRSENERRNTRVFSVKLNGDVQTGAVAHHLSLGWLNSRYESRLGRQAYNWAGIGNVQGTAATSPAPELTDENTNRTEHSNELQLLDRMQWGDAGLWAGVRHTRLERQSVRTDGSRPIDYDQSFTTPWLAVTWQATPADMAYLSWGQGIESAVTPNRSGYGNSAGQPLPALKSRQFEAGFKHESQTLGWSVTGFDISRPQVADTGSTYTIDGQARHRGLEGTVDLREGAWSVRGSAMWLKARTEDSSTAASNNLVPANVAQRVARVQIGYQVAAVPGLSVQTQISHEGSRFVLPDNSVSIPGWTTLGLSSRYAFKAQGIDWLWRVGVDNLTGRRAWQESPYQYGHVYLYPLAGRTFRTSLQINL
ncbi:TonB-dependent siderophore receptor [Ideonella margarita]|uniref:TonB-dependent receptor n=1 Tax=Ideonella margarita TaxID=2984191 RepID=A0ABU9C214_9BURK